MTLEDKPIFDKYFRARDYQSSHFNFTNLFMWRNFYRLGWCEKDGVIYLKAHWETDEFALQPLCSEEKMPEAIGVWIEHFKSLGKPLIFYGIEEWVAEILRNYSAAKFNVVEDRDNFDYVYTSEDLIGLRGKKYHSKKNHLNNFLKNYPEAQYVSITPDNITACKLNVNSWYKVRSKDLPDDPFIPAERDAVIEALNNFAALQLKGGAVVVDKRIIAFSFGEQLNSDTAVVHVEKADPEINGAYTFINREFVAHEWSNLTFINREEDMGIAGLRQAKESYRPIKMIKKYNAEMEMA